MSENVLAIAFMAIAFGTTVLLPTPMKTRPWTRCGYERMLTKWTYDPWYVAVAMVLYDNLNVRFSVEDEEPWFKKLVVRQGKNTIYDNTIDDFAFPIDRTYGTVYDLFERWISEVSKRGMPSIGCPSFSTIRELEVKLQLSGKKKLDKTRWFC